MIERAVITARDGRLNLDRALPATAVAASDPRRGERGPAPEDLLTAEDLLRLERDNIGRALERAGGRSRANRARPGCWAWRPRP